MRKRFAGSLGGKKRHGGNGQSREYALHNILKMLKLYITIILVFKSQCTLKREERTRGEKPEKILAACEIVAH